MSWNTSPGVLAYARAYRGRGPGTPKGATAGYFEIPRRMQAPPAEAGPARRSGRRIQARRSLRIGAERAATVDDRDAFLLGLDDEALQNAVAGISDKVARIEREHLPVAPEPGARAEALVEAEGDLRHLAALGPGGGNAVDALAVAAMDEDQIGDALAHLVERLPDAVGKRLCILGGGEGQAAAGEDDRRSLGHCGPPPRLGNGPEIVAPIDHGGGERGGMV